MHKKYLLLRDLRPLFTLAGVAVSTGLAAQPAPTDAGVAAATDADEDVYVLSPFEVTSDKDTGYVATETLAGTRIRTDLKDVGSAISVVTKEMMNDVGATDNATLLQYTTNAEVAGTRGTYAGMGSGSTLNETAQLTNPGQGQRVRGLDSADNTRDYFGTDIPWDGYNVDRIDIQRGPNSMLFGLGSPAGIINASLRNAQYTNNGAVEFRFDNYGSTRGSIDLNRQIIDNVLAVRVDGLWNNEKYQQKPAFQHDHRAYITLRWDPKIFGPEFATTFKVKYENGNIKANRPRILPPYDSITPWFSSTADEGMGKYVVSDPYSLNSTIQVSNPWLSALNINQQHATWLVDGTTGDVQGIYAGYIHRGARTNTGAVQDYTQTLLGQRYSYEAIGIGGYSTYAQYANLKNQQYGQYRDKSLTDSSVFNFYDNLIDGNNKSEWEDWNALNFSFTQMGWGDRVGLTVDYDYQSYNRGGESLLGGSPAISIDLMQYGQDGKANKNFGRPMVYESNGGSGNSYDSDRRFIRATIFGEFRATDVLDEGFLTKMIGRHRFTGSFSKERLRYENRTWQLYASSMDWASFWTRDTSLANSYNAITERPPAALIYLGPSLYSASSASGANLSNIKGDITLSGGNIYLFDSTWTGGTNYADPWTIPANLVHVYSANFGDSSTQASNPANYVGWNSTKTVNPLTYDSSSDDLLASAVKTLRQTESLAGTWQGYMINDAVIGTFGWRYDKVSTKYASASRDSSNRKMLDMENYIMPDEFPDDAIFSKHSTSWSVVTHLNKFLPHDFLPIDIRLSYNKSDNFRISSVRTDLYGNAIANPAGDTKEYGILLSTKDGKYSFRALKYETNMTGVTVSMSSTAGLDQVIRDGLRFRNRFLYRLAGYDWAVREKAYPADLSGYNAELWYPAWVDNTTDRPVANYTAADPGNAYFETQAQAYARRDASIKAWGQIQQFLTDRGYFQAWGWEATTLSALKDSSGNFIGRTEYENALTSPEGSSTSEYGLGGHGTADIPAAQYTPVASTVKSYTSNNPTFAITADTASEGYEFELTANPLPNWRVAINASKTTANRVNVGGAVLDEYVTFMDEMMAGYAGDMRIYNGNLDQTIRRNVWATWRSQYSQLKLLENAAAAEVRKWRYNVITNYSFTEGFLKGVGVGAAYRWQDKVVIGYPLLDSTTGVANFDISNPYYGPAEDGLDLWISYERQLSDKIGWKIQLNVRNAFQDNGLIPISCEPDGTWAAVRIKPTQEWFITNTFTF